jgi:hypothetical protein
MKIQSRVSKFVITFCEYIDMFHLPEDKLTCTTAAEHAISALQ